MVGRVAACTTSAGGAPSLRFPPRLPHPTAPKAGALGAPVRSGFRQNRASFLEKREKWRTPRPQLSRSVLKDKRALYYAPQSKQLSCSAGAHVHYGLVLCELLPPAHYAEALVFVQPVELQA